MTISTEPREQNYKKRREGRQGGFDGLTHFFCACLMVYFAPLGTLNICNRLFNVFAASDYVNDAHNHLRGVRFPPGIPDMI